MQAARLWGGRGATRRRVLFLGAGCGEDVAACVEAGWDVTCVDCSAGMCDRLRRAHPSMRVVQADARALPDGMGAFFDVVVANCLFNVFVDEEEAVEVAREARARVHAQWGVLAVVDFASSSPSWVRWGAHRGAVEAMHMLTRGAQPRGAASPPDVRRVCASAGWEVVAEDGASGLFASYYAVAPRDGRGGVEELHARLLDSAPHDMSCLAVVGREERALSYVHAWPDGEPAPCGMVAYRDLGSVWLASSPPIGRDAEARRASHLLFERAAHASGAAPVYAMLHASCARELEVVVGESVHASVVRGERRDDHKADCASPLLAPPPVSASPPSPRILPSSLCRRFAPRIAFQVGTTHAFDLIEDGWTHSPSEAKRMRRLQKHLRFGEEEDVVAAWPELLGVRDAWLWRQGGGKGGKGASAPYIDVATPRASPLPPGRVRAWTMRERVGGAPVAAVVGEVAGEGCVTLTSYWESPNLMGVRGGVLDACVHATLSLLVEEARGSATAADGWKGGKGCKGGEARRVSFGTHPLEGSRVPRALRSAAAWVPSVNYDGISAKKRQWERHFSASARGQRAEPVLAVLPALSLPLVAWRIFAASGAPWRTHPRPPAPRRYLVVGAGYSGLLVAARLLSRGHEVVVVDAQRGVGGSWRDRANSWSRTEAPAGVYMRPFGGRGVRAWTRDEVIRAFEGFARDEGLTPHLRFGVTCTHFHPEEQDEDGGDGEAAVDGGKGARAQVPADPRLRVTLRGHCGEELTTSSFDGAVLCTGTAMRARGVRPPMSDHPHAYTASAEGRKIGSGARGRVVVVGGGSFAMEAADELARRPEVTHVHVVMRRPKLLFDARRTARTLALLCLPIPSSWKRRALLPTYDAHGLAHTLPAPDRLFDFHTTSSSVSLFADPLRVRVHIATVDAIERTRGGEGGGEHGSDAWHAVLCTGELLPCDCVVDATGAGVDPRLDALFDGVGLAPRVAFVGDVVNGVGVWTIDAQIDAVERHLRGGGARRGLPTPVDHYPRRVGWFAHRAWTLAWRARAYSPLRLSFLLFRAWLLYMWSAVRKG